MISEEEKLSKFTTQVLRKANEKRAQIAQEIQQKQQAAMEKAELHFLEEAYHTIQAELIDIQKKKKEEIASVQNACKIQLIQKRQAIFDEVFAAVEEKIAAFVTGEEYYSWLLSHVKKAYQDAQDGEKTVYIGKDDGHLLERLKKETALPIETGDMMGGCRVENRTKSLVVDESLDTFLEEAKEDFIQNSGLVMNVLS